MGTSQSANTNFFNWWKTSLTFLRWRESSSKWELLIDRNFVLFLFSSFLIYHLYNHIALFYNLFVIHAWPQLPYLSILPFPNTSISLSISLLILAPSSLPPQITLPFTMLIIPKIVPFNCEIISQTKVECEGKQESRVYSLHIFVRSFLTW